MQAETDEKVLNPTVIKLGLVSLFADISSEMLYPITPIFLTAVLGASMSSLGLIEGVAEAIASLMKTFSGVWSDRISQRKPFVMIGYLLAAVAKPLTGLSTSWTQVLGARALDRTGKGVRGAPRDALLSEAVSADRRGQAFGWHRAMDTIGAAIGPLVAVVFLSYSGQNLRSLYYLALIPGLIAVFFVLAVKEKRAVIAKPVKNFSWKLNWGDFSKEFKLYLLAWGLFSLTNSSDVFLLMKAREKGLSLNSVIFMYCFYNLTYSLMSPYFGKLSDHLPRRRVLIGGLLIFCMVYFGFSFSTETWHFWFLFAAYGFYMAATDGVGKALAVDLVPPSLKASGLGLLGTVTGICALIASTVAGGIWDHFGSSWTFVYGVAGALGSVLVLLV